jgi:hypothetical protein
MRKILFSAALVLAAAPALADQTEGLILAFDRQAHTIVLTDHSVWQLPSDMAIPTDLGQGDRIYIDFTSDGDNGVKAVTLLERLAVAMPLGADGGS